MRGIILAGEDGHVTISELVRVQACPVRFYYEKNEPVTESDRYAICKQLRTTSASPLRQMPSGTRCLLSAPKPTRAPGVPGHLYCVLQKIRMEAGGPDRCNGGLKEARYCRDDRPGGGGRDVLDHAGGWCDALWHLRGRPVRIAGIAFCLEEMTGKEVVGGHVEYIPDGFAYAYRPAPGPCHLLTTLHSPGDRPGRGARPPVECSL